MNQGRTLSGIDRSITLNRNELLRTVYKALDWASLYKMAPHITREEVDRLFRRMSETLAGELDMVEEPAETRQVCHSGDRATIYSDGASKGNPGPAGIGMVIESPSGVEISAWGRSIGEATSNVAEYTALLEALARAKEMGIKELEIRTDSQLMARQLNGRYRVKSNRLKPVFRAVRDILESFDAWKVRHIDRELNKKADKLASSYARKDKGDAR